MRKACQSVPRVYLIGDSTVRVGTPGQRGWGEELWRFFDPDRVEVINRAIGGRSSRTFLTEGCWDPILEDLRSGDVVIIQFGHNDGGPINDDSRARGTLPGTGDESVEIDNLLTGRQEIVYTYGWYLRHYVRETLEKGAMPIVCSPLPHKIWKDGRIVRDRHAPWAREVAEKGGAHFLDLNEIVALRYEGIGPEEVEFFFADERTHTNLPGARFNARCAIDGLKELGLASLLEYLADETGVTADPFTH